MLVINQNDDQFIKS